MPKTLFDPFARRALLARLQSLDATAPARWGTLTAPRMVSHLIEGARMALGDLPVPPRQTFLSNRVMRYLIIHVFPFPKGAPTAPQLLSRAPDDWASDKAALAALMERAAAQSAGGTWQAHPAFGVLAARDWGVLLHKHTDHHLTQFGV